MSYKWSNYIGEVEWLPRRTIFMCRAGSMAYGTNVPDSDEDQRGIFLPPREYVLGYLRKVEQFDNGSSKPNWSIDAGSFSLNRFVKLAVECNPNIIETLFTDQADWLYITPAWTELYAVRDMFLSQQAKHRFSAYALFQLRKIETHRRWLRNPPTHKPTRAEFGLPETIAIPKDQRDALEAMILKTIEEWHIDFACLDEPTRVDLLYKMSINLADMQLAKEDQYVAAGNKLGLDAKAMEHLKAERKYKGAVAEWKQYQTWLKERNPKRSQLEARYGYDTKHGQHLVRLMRMAKEIIAEGRVIVRRPDADELRAIRFDGIWSYERLVEWAKQMDAELEELLKSSKLPKQPDRVGIDEVCCDITEKYLHKDP